MSDAMSQKTNRLRWIIIIALLAVIGLPTIVCCGPPLITGQSCLDFLSGQVPRRAIDRFLNRTFEAAVQEDYDWLAKVTSKDVLADIRANQPAFSTGYKIILADNLLGLYEYRVQFDTGAVMYITLRGEWPTCPDFRVTDEEI
ncbi:MAG: hypothetical protein D6784_16920, partial [Chloroflexi bacterium]